MIDSIDCRKCKEPINNKLFMIRQYFYHENCYRTELTKLGFDKNVEVKCNCGEVFKSNDEFEEHWKIHEIKKQETMESIVEDTQGLIDKSTLDNY